MHELHYSEMKEVNGGILILPVLSAIGSFAGHQAVRTVGGYLFTRAMTTYAVASAAQAAKDRLRKGEAAKDN